MQTLLTLTRTLIAGKYVVSTSHLRSIEINFHLILGQICDSDGNGNGYCSFWSILYETCFLFPSGAGKGPLDVLGAFSGERGCQTEFD